MALSVRTKFINCVWLLVITFLLVVYFANLFGMIILSLGLIIYGVPKVVCGPA